MLSNTIIAAIKRAPGYKIYKFYKTYKNYWVYMAYRAYFSAPPGSD